MKTTIKKIILKHIFLVFGYWNRWETHKFQKHILLSLMWAPYDIDYDWNDIYTNSGEHLILNPNDNTS